MKKCKLQRCVLLASCKLSVNDNFVIYELQTAGHVTNLDVENVAACQNLKVKS